MKPTIIRFILPITTAALVAGCASSGVKNPSGTGVTQLKADEQGTVVGTGIESQDLVAVTDKMARVRTPEDPPALGDPFHFRLVSDNEAAERLKQSLGPEARLEPVYLRPATTRQTLVRMCSNLKHIHVGKQEWLRAIGLCDRILLLAPEMATEHRDRAVLYARLECFGPALADLEKYLELEPNAEDAEEVRENIEQLRPLVRRIN